eukprot:COSAG05_NODE_3889_length_1787_cov_4.441351_2_plen_109_part_00
MGRNPGLTYRAYVLEKSAEGLANYSCTAVEGFSQKKCGKKISIYMPEISDRKQEEMVDFMQQIAVYMKYPKFTYQKCAQCMISIILLFRPCMYLGTVADLLIYCTVQY